MIFLTVGAQMPFDRLVQGVDAWMRTLPTHARPSVIAQVGRSTYRPSNFEAQPFLDPIDFREALANAKLVVTHAGMGTILTALEFGRPLLVMPRRRDLDETRNDHQFGTAQAMLRAGRVRVAWDECELPHLLDHRHRFSAPKRISSVASFELLDAVRSFVHGNAEIADSDGAEPTYRFPASHAAERKAA